MNLPDLAIAAGMMISDEYEFIADASVEWQLIRSADSRRWLIEFIGTNGADVPDYRVTTKPDDTSAPCVLVRMNAREAFEFQKAGPVVAKNWYVFTGGAAGKIRFFECLIQRTKPFEGE